MAWTARRQVLHHPVVPHERRLVKRGLASIAWAFVLGGIIIGLFFFLVTSLLERLATRRMPV